MTNVSNITFNFGDRRLVGQDKARDYISRIIHSDRLGHAYLLSGPRGTGKTALALAFAEILNGIDNLTDLGDQAFSKKSSWLNHPDIHLFLPVPTSYNMEELGNRLGLLNEDPYELADFSHRPSLTDQESTKNKQSFYPIDFFHEEIRPKAFLKPNEGNKTVIILTEIETMRKEAANAFLKLLEEPSENIVFLLTTNSTDALLPTIISRCQQIKLNTLPTKTIKNALIEHDNVPEDDAAYLARICGGNYTMARFFDTETLKETRGEVIEYLRNAFTQDAVKLIETAKNWQNKQNINGQIATLNVLETFLRDLLIYRSTQEKSLLVNADQIETIQKFCTKLGDARLEEMIAQIEQCRTLIYQNVQPKLVFATLSLRFSNLMRDFDLPIAENESWKHLPAYID